ncbi:protein kinase family protein [Streptomyces sp. NPDC048566]|uniref:protein kinase family protein n=1 Tax=Streptomyces sp. NPDC048566 TaxID=3365569 RepID=UPI003714B828
MPDREPLRAARLADYAGVSTCLSLLGDRRLGRAVAAAVPLGSGIGGRCGELDVDGTRVFVKRIPLTDAELRPENVRSTANIFDLPLFYQYGVGSAGFGAWRELAVHTMTTNWVLADAYAGFPLMYHWRVLPDSPPEGFTDAFGGVDGAVAHWEGSPAVRDRLEAIGSSSWSLVVFLEHVPHTLADWLAAHRRSPQRGSGDDLPLRWVEAALMEGAAFMSARGLVHFDAHFANVLTDGHRLYFADFGLALSSRFDLSSDASRFLSEHLAYDRRYTASHLLRHHLLDQVRGETEHEDFLRDWIAGQRPGDVPSEIADNIDRHARPTVVMNSFIRGLVTETRRTPFPAAEIERQAGVGAAAAG